MEEGTWGEDYYTNQCDGTQYNGIQIHKYTEIQIQKHKYTDIQIQYKYVNQCDGKLEEAAVEMQ